MTPLIGLAGYSKVGKSLLASMLEGYKVASFAAELKRRVDPLFPPETPKEAKRDVYVAYGAAMRKVDPGHWIRTIKVCGPTVIDDCRYADEVEWIVQRGGIVLYIVRPGFFPANDEEASSFREMHHSHDLPVVKNDGTPEEAMRQVMEYVNPLKAIIDDIEKNAKSHTLTTEDFWNLGEVVQ